MTTDQLSACPFCGSRGADLLEVDNDGWAVVCSGCATIGPVEASQSAAVQRWNARVTLAHNLGLMKA